MAGLDDFVERFRGDGSEVRRWVIEAMVLGAAADGEFDPRETEQIVNFVTTHAEFTGMTRDDLRRVLERSLNAILEDGFSSRLHAVAGGLDRYAHRVLAFRAAVCVAFADGRVTEDEFGLLRQMQEVLGIADSDVRRAIDDAGSDSASPIPLSVEPVEAYLDVLLMAAAADGVLEDEELATIIAFVVTRPEFEGLDDDQLRNYIQSNLRHYSAGGIEPRLETLRDDLPLPEQRENAYGLATAMAISDGEVADLERDFLKALQQALALDDARAEIVRDQLLSSRPA